MVPGFTAGKSLKDAVRT
ncbi:hypothetical protein [Nonomuraea sp. KM90]